MSPSHLLLDLDGPLLDVRARYVAVHEQLVTTLGLGGSPAAAYWEAKRERTPLATLLRVAPDDPRLAAYREGWSRTIESDAMLALDTVQPDALRTLAALPRTVRRTLVSMRTNVAGAAATLDRVGLRTHLDDVIWVPHADGDKIAAYRRALAGHVPPAAPPAAGTARSARIGATTAAIGDTEVDCDAARATGVRFVGVSCGIRTAARLRAAGATEVVGDLAAACALLGWTGGAR